MYNRYIPQADGSFRRNLVPDSIPCPPVSPPKPSVGPPQPQPGPIPNPPPSPQCSKKKCLRHCPHSIPEEKPSLGLSAFWKQILPADFDTGDLIVVLLLLLMSSDCKEDHNTALLTLVLYLFL